jgi:cytidine deaminase
MAELSSKQIEQLLSAAQRASEHAYAPFSKFCVGAAILTRRGEIFTGCNVENSSYGLTNCAERTAIFTAVAAGALSAEHDLIALAVVHRQDEVCTPCGACRQVICEFGLEAVVIYRAPSGEIVHRKAKELLPDGFRLR